jgi:uncharacterized membrane protein YoaT (DUF817 family)
MRKLFVFAWNQALCCIFPVVIFASMALTKFVSFPILHRYDLLLLICLAAQVLMVRFGLESKDELKVITLFHLIGLGLEMFKVHMGSWTYPDEGWTKVGGVPLYSGFMYASVASYICQAWRRFDLSMERWPNAVLTTSMALLIYANFFTHHYVYDIRWVLMAALLVVFPRTIVQFRVEDRVYRMHILVSFALIAFFIWIAENLSSLLGAYRYPNQSEHWAVVSWGKFTSWFLLIIISVMIVAQLKRVKDQIVKPQGTAPKVFL